ncbi:hypothetical protein GWI33_006415 [Rhynchophorus ferrugineus]|uniref:Uncharacterized protein n=1 Tax=Rhynchophorus ferrugineus TaxID=354439 RepID=A0A834IHP6_RHYFE|nr:hypothetical protein GWI33_006415 [Rhynchophorus ferrugineus]
MPGSLSLPSLRNGGHIPPTSSLPSPTTYRLAPVRKVETSFLPLVLNTLNGYGGTDLHHENETATINEEIDTKTRDTKRILVFCCSQFNKNLAPKNKTDLTEGETGPKGTKRRDRDRRKKNGNEIDGPKATENINGRNLRFIRTTIGSRANLISERGRTRGWGDGGGGERGLIPK